MKTYDAISIVAHIASAFGGITLKQAARRLKAADQKRLRLLAILEQAGLGDGAGGTPRKRPTNA